MTASSGPAVVVVKAQLTVNLVHHLAEAFTAKYDDETPLHALLVHHFGVRSHRWYALDMSSHIWWVTFSDEANPALLTYNKIPARMVNPAWTIWLQTADVVRPGRIAPNARHPMFIQHE